MSLLDLIHRKPPGPVATAIPAIRAIALAPKPATVAGIATVAVATPQNEKGRELLESPSDTETAGGVSQPSQRANGPRARASVGRTKADCSPQDAQKPNGKGEGASDAMETARAPAWLAPARLDAGTLADHIEPPGDDASDDHEHPDDAATQRHTARRHRFLAVGLALDRAEAAADLLAARDSDLDDRRMCVECSHFGTRGRCIAARVGRLIGAARDLEPVPDLLQRCEAFGLRKGLE